MALAGLRIDDDDDDALRAVALGVPCSLGGAEGRNADLRGAVVLELLALVGAVTLPLPLMLLLVLLRLTDGEAGLSASDALTAAGSSKYFAVKVFGALASTMARCAKTTWLPRPADEDAAFGLEVGLSGGAVVHEISGKRSSALLQRVLRSSDQASVASLRTFSGDRSSMGC